ncbi:MAG: ATP synthase F1 subunit delta [Planctomycetia bacterium]|nr:ATP synthase F1 subunit delta [Planctomycetia bacterium]
MQNKIEQDALYVSQLDADATKAKLAEIYAEALLNAAKDAGVSQDVIVQECDEFLTQVLLPFPQFEQILISLCVAHEEKARIIDSVAKDASDTFRSFLKVLARRARMDLYREINAALRKIICQNDGKILVYIESAKPIDEQTLGIIADKIQKAFGAQPLFIPKVNPELIGGFVLRVEDRVYDASIANQLNIVRQNMINRSAHEIQSRRDCFRNPEGN